MKKVFLIAGFYFLVSSLYSQNISEKLQKAYHQFESDSQLKHAIGSLYVINAKTGEVVFDKNSQVGLAPASTQKIIMAATAFELLGKDFRYETKFSYAGPIKGHTISSGLILEGSGDPTLGSWRYKNTKPESIFSNLQNALDAAGIKQIVGPITYSNTSFDYQNISGGWIWEDVANYYGAGSDVINWRENQYDLKLIPGKNAGDTVRIAATDPQQYLAFINQLRTADKNSGDNAYIYFAPSRMLVKGTVPCCVDSFIISGSVFDSKFYAISELSEFLSKSKYQSERFAIDKPFDSTKKTVPIGTILPLSTPSSTGSSKKALIFTVKH